MRTFRFGAHVRKDKVAPSLSATFRSNMPHYGSSSLTFDEQVALFEREQKRRRDQKRNMTTLADGSPRPVSLQQTFAIAHAIAASPASKKRVKLATFSIQQRELSDEIDA